MHYNALPPTRLHGKHKVKRSAAHAFLTRYLETAAHDPSRRPDAELTDAGPAPAAAGGAEDVGLALLSLQRIAAGLAGQRLGRTVVTITDEPAEPMMLDGAVDEEGDETDEWMDKAAFERMQEGLEGEIGVDEGVAGTKELEGRDRKEAGPEVVVANEEDDAEAAAAAERRRKKKERRERREKNEEKKGRREKKAKEKESGIEERKEKKRKKEKTKEIDDSKQKKRKEKAKEKAKDT